MTGGDGNATSKEIWSTPDGQQSTWDENSGKPFQLTKLANKAPSITDTVTGNNNVQTSTGYTTDPTSNVNNPAINSGQCWVGAANGFLDIKNCFYQSLYYGLFWPISWILGLAGWIFNFTFDYTVIHMADGVKNIGAIDVAWKTMRDLANIGFIFILIWLAISTILGVGEHDVKHTLSKLILVAILLNFSLFFTKIIIDASNILAIAFFNAIIVQGSGTTGTGATGIGDAFMGAFRLQGLFAQGTTTSGQAFAASSQPISVLVGGSITMLVAIAILIASLGMFIKRYVILILVMIFSPLAFAGMVLHQTEHSVQQWWDFLLKEALFAPIYMIFLWISFTIINDPHFLTAIGYTNQNLTLADSLKATDTGGNPNTPGTPGVLIDFMFVAGLLIASLIAAENMGVAGASGAMGFAKGFGGAIGAGSLFTAGQAYTNTVGRFANTLVNKEGGLWGHSDKLARMKAGGGTLFSGIPVVGKVANYGQKYFARGVTSLARSTGKGFAEDVEGTELQVFKDEIEEAHDDDNKKAEILERYSRKGLPSKMLQALDKLHHGFSTEEHANVALKLEEDSKEVKKDASGKAILDSKGKEILTDKAKAASAALARYYQAHKNDKGEITHYGRVSADLYNAIERKKESGNGYYDDLFRRQLNEARKNPTDLAAKENLEKFILGAKTQGIVISAIDASGEYGEVIKNDPVLAKKLQDAIRTRFAGEGFYNSISKDDGIGVHWQEIVGNAAWRTAMLSDLYEIMSQDTTKRTTENVGKFKEFLSDVKGDAEIDKAVAGGNIDDMINAYKANRLAADSSLAKYAHQTNGSRSLKMDTRTALELQDHKNRIGGDLSKLGIKYG